MSNDTIKRSDAIKATWQEPTYTDPLNVLTEVRDRIEAIPSADRPQGWIPCSERLPRIYEKVLLSSTEGAIYFGHRAEPELVWQVKDSDRVLWVYDPENYTDDVDSLQKAEDCAFDEGYSTGYGWLSVTSVNYNPRFEGIIAWMPLPEPWKGADDERKDIQSTDE